MCGMNGSSHGLPAGNARWRKPLRDAGRLTPRNGFRSTLWRTQILRFCCSPSFRNLPRAAVRPRMMCRGACCSRSSPLHPRAIPRLLRRAVAPPQMTSWMVLWIRRHIASCVIVPPRKRFPRLQETTRLQVCPCFLLLVSAHGSCGLEDLFSFENTVRPPFKAIEICLVVLCIHDY